MKRATVYCRRVRTFVAVSWLCFLWYVVPAVAEPVPLKLQATAIFEHTPGDWNQAQWDARTRLLSSLGYTAMFAELAYGGYAHFPSSTMVQSEVSKNHGDQIMRFVEAAKTNQIQPYVVKLAFNVQYGRGDEFLPLMRKEGRLMEEWNPYTGQQNENGWLNPADPRNQQLNVNTIIEIVKRYKVTGIMLDYIRYTGYKGDVSEGSRRLFEEHIGHKVENWPVSVLPSYLTCVSKAKCLKDGELFKEFTAWKADVITRHVENIYRKVKEINPNILLTAAVFPDPDDAYAHGQDWRRWMQLGIIDTVYPMNYTTDEKRFAQMLATQKQLQSGRIPIFPIINVAIDDTPANRVNVAKQMISVMNAGFKGLMIYPLQESRMPANLEDCGAMVPTLSQSCIQRRAMAAR